MTPCVFAYTRRIGPMVDGGHAHSGNAVHDLIGQALPHEAGPDHADANGQALHLTRPESLVHDDHRVILPFNSGSTSARSFQLSSFSEISVTGIGHVRPSRGSLYRSPPSEPGV